MTPSQLSYPSPVREPYVDDAARTLASTRPGAREAPAFELAGPRARLAFEPRRMRAAILTAGGLCPGTNHVIRSLVLELVHGYGVRAISGIRYGFEGLPVAAPAPFALDAPRVRDIHHLGGTVLGTSRVRMDTGALADAVAQRELDAIFAIGGNGTLRAAHELAGELAARRSPAVVVALPKTIDDDIAFVDRTFGFETAVAHATAAIDAAHAEARSAKHGIAVVKLMGRDAGFIAAHAALASGEANLCLVPEYPMPLPDVAAYVERRLALRGHAVIVVAEGCGKQLARRDSEHDAAGNLRYASAGLDIGPVICETLRARFALTAVPINLKYIDPSYTIRAAPANASDAAYAALLARHAVHAALAGRTDIVVGPCRGTYAHIPLALAVEHVPRIGAELYAAVCATTGQLRA